jgi:hypothetical protein
LTVGDLEQDGSPEIITTTDAGDAIDILDVATAGATPESRMHLAPPDPVRALAMCPAGEQGAPALAAVTAHEVWLVRPALAISATSPKR